MKKVLFLFMCLVSILASCSNSVKKENTKPVDAIKSDTVYLNLSEIKSKLWIEHRYTKDYKRAHILKFLNDTVIKYYMGSDNCWDENFKAWERYYDCYKFYNDTIETIAKLVPKPKDDSKYEIMDFYSWKREYLKYKLFVYTNYNSERDTIFQTYDGNTYRKYHTLTEYRRYYKHQFTMYLDK